jgi:DMSO/TMAO reductase YedYZ molybdopterin-dependent catalytic subunit
MSDWPPNQTVLNHFPRFGVYYASREEIGASPPLLFVRGAVDRVLELPLERLAALPRRDQRSDFHCVTGWSREGVAWSGVPFRTFFDTVVRGEAGLQGGVTHVVFEGADGFRTVYLLEDALGDDVLLADHLDGAPLTFDHGAPLRIVSPAQYGYKNAKHLVAIEFHRGEPPEGHRTAYRRFMLSLLMPHPRARVALEERHRFLPTWSIRAIYRLMAPRPV